MEYQEYPKFIPKGGVVAQNREEEEAILQDRAVIKVVSTSAQGGDVRELVAIEPSPKKEHK